jgi:hypothetical protein
LALFSGFRKGCRSAPAVYRAATKRWPAAS